MQRETDRGCRVRGVQKVKFLLDGNGVGDLQPMARRLQRTAWIVPEQCGLRFGGALRGETRRAAGARDIAR